MELFFYQRLFWFTPYLFAGVGGISLLVGQPQQGLGFMIIWSTYVFLMWEWNDILDEKYFHFRSVKQ